MAKRSKTLSEVGQRTKLRCAIYTRKSSEEGLEQDFNSLDAQREACEAYVASQKHGGWVTLPQKYDDGGFSGGTMERPALMRLLADIEAGKVDIVVVYKVDRLTRALGDFSKIVDVLDGKGASFVSVTQQFNTTTSMGRLTLNVLLSFAQFEREVTGERIRDKIAASKQKGMWMGGLPPLGYDPKDRTLVVNRTEAETVRTIFQTYRELRSVGRLKERLDAMGIVSKTRRTAQGRSSGGLSIARGALYLMLQNRIYRGEIVHKGRAYPEGHEAIVEEGLWNDVQAILTENRVDRETGSGAITPSLLAGILFDADGERMTPTHSLKKGKRYRYYVSAALIGAGRDKAGKGQRLPATAIEAIVGRRIGEWLADLPGVMEALETGGPDQSARSQKDIAASVTRLASRWDDLAAHDLRQILRAVCTRIQVQHDQVEIGLAREALKGQLGVPIMARDSDALGEAAPITLVVPVRLRRAGLEMRLIVEDGTEPARIDPGIIRVLIRAHGIRRQLTENPNLSLADIAEREGVVPSYVTRIFRVNFLAPDIVTAMLEGRQAPDLTIRQLLDDARAALDWREQRRALSFT